MVFVIMTEAFFLFDYKNFYFVSDFALPCPAMPCTKVSPSILVLGRKILSTLRVFFFASDKEENG